MFSHQCYFSTDFLNQDKQGYPCRKARNNYAYILNSVFMFVLLPLYLKIYYPCCTNREREVSTRGKISSPWGHLEENKSSGLKTEPYYKSYIKLIKRCSWVNKTETALLRYHLTFFSSHRNFLHRSANSRSLFLKIIM